MSRADVIRLAREGMGALPLYAPDLAQCAVDLSDNTNLWGPPPSAQLAVERVGATLLTRYPSPFTRELTRVLAGYLGVETEMVVAGCGSDDILDSAIRAFGEHGDRLAQFDPTFGMIRTFATVNGLSVAAVPLTTECRAEAILETKARIIYLCSPNNPTGKILDAATIESVVADAPGIVIIDEAYAEFAGVSSIGLLAEYENLLITRTLSKAFGLAGLRVGYAAGSPDLVREVEKSRGPYRVSSVAERAAIAAVSNDREWMRDKVKGAVAGRERFIAGLKEMGLEPWPSDANFVFVPVADSVELAGRLAMQGVAVRALTNLQGIGDALRITVGPWPMMEECLVALESVFQ